MGIQIEFNPDLALRDISQYNNGEKQLDECISNDIEVGQIYNFLKKGQRNYYLLDDTPVPLVKTNGNSQLSRPLAAIQILEVTHFNNNGEVWTKGRYKILEIFDYNNNECRFEGFSFLKNKF